MRHTRRETTPKTGFIAQTLAIHVVIVVTRAKAATAIRHLANSQYSAKLLALKANFPSNSDPLIREAVICRI